ncbi:MAG: twin-arginine translocase subunit TatC [Bacteroidota bacterium]
MSEIPTESGQAGEQVEMNFFDHLGELRTRLLWAVLGIAIGCIVAGIYTDELMAILLKPASNANLELQNLQPMGQIFLLFKVILIAGIILSSPWVLYQIWRFVAPGLYSHERAWARKITLFTSICFLAGVAFAYFVMIPSSMKFASETGFKDIKNSFDVNLYFGFVTTFILAMGLVFEMPMIAYVLAQMGILTSEFMRKYRRHAFIIILLIAAIATPTPDPVNQMIFAVPLWILYEISVWIVRISQKPKVLDTTAA